MLGNAVLEVREGGIKCIFFGSSSSAEWIFCLIRLFDDVFVLFCFWGLEILHTQHFLEALRACVRAGQAGYVR